MPSWTEALRKRFEGRIWKYGFVVYFFGISDSYGDKSATSWFTKKQFRIEFVDVVEQFAKCARAVIEQLFALLRGGFGGIADRAALMQVLRLPRELDRPMRREPAKL